MDRQRINTLMYTAFVKDRMQLANFFASLASSPHKLLYRNLYNNLSCLCVTQDTHLGKFMNGAVGDLHNQRMSVSCLPTVELFVCVLKVLKCSGQKNLEDLGTGCGLIPHTFRSLNMALKKAIDEKFTNFLPKIMQDCEPLEMITGSDPGYLLQSITPFADTDVKNLDILHLAMNKNGEYRDDTAYMMVNPPISNDMFNTYDFIISFIKNRKPRVFILIHDKNYTQMNLDDHKVYKITPAAFSNMDNVPSNDGKTSTKLWMYIYLRNDVNQSFNLNDLSECVIEPYTYSAKNTLCAMVYSHCMPKFIAAEITLEEHAKNLMLSMAQIGLTSIPTHIADIHELSFFMLLCTIAKKINIVPSGLNNRENFLRLKEHFQTLSTNYSQLKINGVVPNHLPIEEAPEFLVRVYSEPDMFKSAIYVHYERSRYFTD